MVEASNPSVFSTATIPEIQVDEVHFGELRQLLLTAQQDSSQIIQLEKMIGEQVQSGDTRNVFYMLTLLVVNDQ